MVSSVVSMKNVGHYIVITMAAGCYLMTAPMHSDEFKVISSLEIPCAKTSKESQRMNDKRNKKRKLMPMAIPEAQEEKSLSKQLLK